MKIEEKEEFEEKSAVRRNMSGPGGRHDRGDRETEQHRKLFIGGLTYSTTDDQLRDFYGQWGEIVDCIVMRDPMTKRSRGFGFITYSEATMLDEAMQHRPHVIDGKEVEPKRAVPRELSNKAETQMSVKRLFVSGIKDDHTTEMLHEYFTTYGEVADVDIIIDKATGAKRGFAFVTFEDYDPVDKCVLKKSHMIAGKRCDVKKALSKDEMMKAQQQERDRAGRGERTRGGGYGSGGSDRGSNYGGYSDRGGRNSDYGAPSGGMGGASAWSQGSGPTQSWGQPQQSPWGQMGPSGGYGQPQAPVMASGAGGYGGASYGGGNGGGYGGSAAYQGGYAQPQQQMAQTWGNQPTPSAVPAATGGYGQQQANSWAQQPMPQQNPWQQSPAAATYPPSYGTQPTGGNPGWGQQPAVTATGGYGAAQQATTGAAGGYSQPAGSAGGWSYGK